ncbi:MAG: site-2 protease family protein [Sphingomonas bacterium]|uniref:site-2 protease family protein n=1 Tax=Sphingomonas bacterium TaxID=1895847 RepID=UPI0026118BF1|nr:site-2 protease family protein [Sphingomonas bacterium]MDB5694765.1 site-2 protease family protein [Sphingomonas bacterium]
MGSDNLIYRAAVWIVPLIIAIVFHEVAHGWVARLLGDPTAAEQKRLSFNPLRHVDPVGTVVLPLGLALAGAPVFGWAKPVPVDYRRLREPRTGMMLVALAGPGMNFALAMIGAVVLGLTAFAAPDATGGVRFVIDALFAFIAINVFLALFNLLPIPPFDGGHVVEGLLPRRAAAVWARLGRFGFVLLFGLLVILPMLAPQLNLVQRFVAPPARAVTDWFIGIAAAIA